MLILVTLYLFIVLSFSSVIESGLPHSTVNSLGEFSLMNELYIRFIRFSNSSLLIEVGVPPPK